MYMKTLITVNNPDLIKIIFKREALEKLESFSEIHWIENEHTYLSSIDKYDACISSWGSPRFTTEILAKATKLKFIGHAAGTVVPYLDESVFYKDIAIVNANYALSHATAEGAVAMMVAGAYNLPMYNRKLLQGGWANNDAEFVPGLFRQTIGLIGYGDICKEVIGLIKPYQANILLYSNYCSKVEAEVLGVRLCTLEELLQEANIISLHNTLTSSSKGMIGKRELRMLKDGALLINTARGPIIDESALVETLSTGRINAILDVFDREPLPENHSLRKLPNVWLFPHIAAYSGYWKTRLGLCVIEDLESYIKGEELKGRVTLEKYQRMTPR
jgi:phosphoglycerate dehydrogenase-like enzyme